MSHEFEAWHSAMYLARPAQRRTKRIQLARSRLCIYHLLDGGLGGGGGGTSPVRRRPLQHPHKHHKSAAGEFTALEQRFANPTNLEPNPFSFLFLLQGGTCLLGRKHPNKGPSSTRVKCGGIFCTNSQLALTSTARFVRRNFAQWVHHPSECACLRLCLSPLLLFGQSGLSASLSQTLNSSTAPLA